MFKYKWSTNLGEYGHPAEKPLPLMLDLIKLIGRPGDVFLDPFAGSGTTLVAAKMLGFYSIGIEVNPIYADIASKRLQNTVQLEIPSDNSKFIWHSQKELF